MFKFPSITHACCFKLALSLFITAVPSLRAQSFTVLKDFPANGVDGGNPVGSGVVVGNKLYGVTKIGGTNGMGVLYRMNTDGSQFEKLRDFSQSEGRPHGGFRDLTRGAIAAFDDRIFIALENNGVWSPDSPRLYTYLPATSVWLPNSKTTWYETGQDVSVQFVANGNLWGSASSTLFRWNLDGSSATQTIKSFAGGTDGEQPVQIIDAGDKIYGVTLRGGVTDRGILFGMNNDGSSYEPLHSFDAGTWPMGIVVIGAKIYGVSREGGSSRSKKVDPNGYLFSFDTVGGGYKELKTYDSDKGFNAPTSIATDGVILYVGMDSHSADNCTGGVVTESTDGKKQETAVVFPEPNTWTGETPVGMVFHNGRLYGWNFQQGGGGLGTIWSYEPSLVPVKFLPRKRSVAGGKTAKIMAMVSNDSLQTREVTLTFSSSNPDVIVNPRSTVITVPGKKNTKSSASFTRIPLTVTAGGTVKGEVKVYATDGSFSASPCTLMVK